MYLNDSVRYVIDTLVHTLVDTLIVH